MWFKNLQVYRFTRPFELTAEQLETQLEECAFTPCGSQDISRFGWTRPLGKFGSTLTHAAAGQILICARKEDKILPPAVVKEALAEKIEAIETEQGRALKKKEKAALKEELLHTMLPRAFSRTANTFAWINPADGLLMVDASSVKKADDVLALLRKSIGSLPVVPVALKNPPEITMTEWLQKGSLPAAFTLEDESELRSAMEHGGIARFKQQDLMTDEVKNHLANDKLVTKLALNWGERLSFVLGDDLSIKRLKFSEDIREQNDDITSEDPAARLDADFALVTGELSQFIPALFNALGGEEACDGRSVSKSLPETERQGEEDALYQPAVEFVTESGRASVSAIQRHFRIGYNRAAWLTEAMESGGVISKPDSQGLRKVIAKGAA